MALYRTFSIIFLRQKGGSFMKESKFQSRLICDLDHLLPGCIIQKMDSSYTQGFPDLLILFGDRWALLECKRSKDAPRQPNQDYYVGLLDRMSFARFIYPENKEEVLRDLQQAFGSCRPTRNSRAK